MKSFELMDTLFTRYCKKEDLFGYIEHHYPYPEFQARRLTSERIANERYGLNTSLDLIYEVFKELTDVCTLDTFDLLKEYELNLELENSIPILCNIVLLGEEDIFLDDAYFTQKQIIPFLNKHNLFEKPVYRFTDSSIPETVEHIGTKSAPNLKCTNAHLFTTCESLLYHSPIQKTIRSFRLKNPHLENSEAYRAYHQQTSSILPILLLFCIHLQKIMLKEKRTKVLIGTQGLYHMFSIVFPDMECVLFSMSNSLYLYPTPSYKEYVQKVYQDKSTLIAELYGTFELEGYRYKDVFGSIPRVHALVHGIECEFPSMTSCIETKKLSMEYVDSLSYDSRGMLFSMIEGNELRLHETKPKPSMELLLSFSQEFANLDIVDLEIPSILLQLIEASCLT
jgi:hypothetical protein